MIENIRLAIRGIFAHKMRSFLTMLGIIIGIAAIIAIVSTIKGTNEEIKENLIGTGDNTVEIRLYQGDYPYEYEYTGLPAGMIGISDEVMDQILDEKKVVGAARYHYREIYDSVNYKGSTLSGGKLCGVEGTYFSVCGYTLREGRSFTARDSGNFMKVAVIDEQLERNLFQGEKALGACIEIKGEPFVVVGVVKKRKEFEPTIHSMEDYYTYSEGSSGNIFIPDALWPVLYQFDEPENVVVKAESVDDMTETGKNVAAILNSVNGTSDKEISYQADDLLEQAKEIQQLSQSNNMMLLWIAAISLLVGGIGVMNIMLVSVTERTNEIGLKKAIGARKSKIMLQFLTEAVVLTSIGGVLGVITGIVLAQIISAVSSIPVAISGAASVGAVVFSMGIGIIFGLLPSRKAANLNPIDALRHE